MVGTHPALGGTGGVAGERVQTAIADGAAVRAARKFAGEGGDAVGPATADVGPATATHLVRGTAATIELVAAAIAGGAAVDAERVARRRARQTRGEALVATQGPASDVWGTSDVTNVNPPSLRLVDSDVAASGLLATGEFAATSPLVHDIDHAPARRTSPKADRWNLTSPRVLLIGHP